MTDGVQLHASSPGRPAQQGSPDVRPGHLVYWRDREYIILANIASPPFRLLVQDVTNASEVDIRHLVHDVTNSHKVDKSRDWLAGESTSPKLPNSPEGVQELLMQELLLCGASSSAGPFFAPTHAALMAKLAHPPHSPITSNTTDIPAALLTRADEIITLVRQVEAAVADERRATLAHGEQFLLTAALDRALQALPKQIHRATYYRALRLYREYGGVRAAIATALHRRTLNQTGMNRAQLHFIDMVIMRWYARDRPLKPSHVYAIARDSLSRIQGHWIDPDRCPKVPLNVVNELLDPNIPIATIVAQPEKSALLTKIEMPSRTWFYHYLHYYSESPDHGEDVITARYGHGAWENEHQVFDDFVHLASFPLQYVFADHWLIDLFIVDTPTRTLIIRLWFTALLDACSRSVLGMALLYEEPCIDSIQLALRHAIWPKPDVEGVHNMQMWTCYGIPLMLFLDNAWAHHSLSLEDLAHQISQEGEYASIGLNFRPPYMGRYGAIIERMFGNLSGKLKAHLPGAIQSSDRKALRNAARQACLIYDDIQRFLLDEIITYQNTVHKELTGHMTPEEKWREGWQMGFPNVPPLTKEVNRLFWRLDPGTRVIANGGVSAFGMHYTSKTINRLPTVGVREEKVRYNFRFAPSNLNRIALFHDGNYMEDVQPKQLLRPDGTYEDVSLWEKKMAQAIAREREDSPRNWLRYVTDIDALTKQRINEKKDAEAKQRQAAAQASKPSYDAGLIDAALEPEPTEEDDEYTQYATAFAPRSSQRSEAKQHTSGQERMTSSAWQCRRCAMQD